MRLLACLLIATATLGAHELAPNLVLPQRHVIHWHPVPVPTPRPLPAPAVEIERVAAAVRIVGRLATTTIDVHLRNPAQVQQEAEVLLPVPGDAVVTGLDFEGGGVEPSARLLPREEAVRLYRAIVSRAKDPALMEFISQACIRTSVFPVPAHGGQRVRLVYEQHLALDGQRLDYVLPRSDHVGGGVPWSITVELRSDQPVASAWSPSHELREETRADGSLRLVQIPGRERTAGSFRLSWLIADGAAATASVVAYPDSVNGGGWFLLMAGTPEVPAVARAPIPRELSLVFDRSGSMNGEKIEQARAAALQIIAGLDRGERFNLFCYNHGVERFAPEPVVKDAETEAAARAWIAAMMPRGGTNIHDALHAALAQPTVDGHLPVVLFMTDGIATVGATGEAEIRAMAKGHNPHDRRIFTFGVGEDVNTHLLEKLADDSRAAAAFVLPGEDIELAAATTFERLRGPVLRDLELSARSGERHRPGRLLDLSPVALGDLFAGEEMLLLGRYTAGEALDLVVTGSDAAGQRHAVTARLDPAAASTVHGYVPRLWASRRIAVLIDAIRQLGMDGDHAAHQHDPRYRELVDEVVRLSTEFGILTEYTAFLAEEGSVLAGDGPAAAAEAAFRDRAFEQRAGRGAVAQSLNAARRKTADTLNLTNRYVDEDLAEVDAGAVIQPQSEKALYKRSDGWVEGGLLEQARPADRHIAFASDAYFAVAERLAASGRQSLLALDGRIRFELDGELVEIGAP